MYNEKFTTPCTSEEVAKRTFEHYKTRISYEADISKIGYIRYNVIEYLCRFPKINPVQMGAALMLDGYKIAFDNSSIAPIKNAQMRHHVESATGLNSMCFNCATRCHGCDGTTNKLWSGCIYKTVEG